MIKIEYKLLSILWIYLCCSHVKVSTPFYAQEKKGSHFVEINTI